MERLVRMTAPVGRGDFILKTCLMLVLGNLLAMVVVFSVHGSFPSGLDGQLIETTIIALPFTVFFLKIIGHLRSLQLKLSELAATDVLTGLRNRRAFFTDVETLRSKDGAGYVFLADADHFKMINDTYGHDVGDLCLVAIAERFRALSHDRIVVARMGGEEFAVFEPGATAKRAEMLGASICLPIEVSLDGTVGQLRLTMSVGAAPVQDAQALREVISLADNALYEAKAGGRARAVVKRAGDTGGAGLELAIPA